LAQIDYILFLQQAERQLEFIAHIKADLQEYANRPDAKDSYIDKRNIEIATHYHFYENAIIALETIRVDNANQYSRGKADGYRNKENEIENIPKRYFDREAARAYSIDKAQKLQPHLF
jgi:hypothetical protein